MCVCVCTLENKEKHEFKKLNTKYVKYRNNIINDNGALVLSSINFKSENHSSDKILRFNVPLKMV